MGRDKEMLALPPATGNSLRKAADEAMEAAADAIATAIHAKLDDKEDRHRFVEVQRLSVIGRAVLRQKGRMRGSRVSDVDLGSGRRRRFGLYQNPAFACGGDDPGGLEAIAREDEAEDMGGSADPYAVAPEPPRFLGAGDPLQDALGGPANGLAAGMRAVMEPITKEREREADSVIARNRAQTLRSLLEAQKAAEGPAVATLQRQIDSLLAEMEKDGEKADEPDPAPRAPQAPPAPQTELSAICTDPDCGQVKGVHWQTEEGLPLNCDLCGSAMEWGQKPAVQPLIVENEPGHVELRLTTQTRGRAIQPVRRRNR